MIVGRGAHVVLADRPDVFRLRVVSSPENCAKRIAARDKITEKEALAKVREVNREREQYIHSLFRNRGLEPWEYDLTICTDIYNQNQAVEVCVAAMRAKGIAVKEPGEK